jgi:hypothetical protein
MYGKFSEGHKEVKDTAGKIIANLFWDSEGVIHVDFLPHGVIINGQYYSNLLPNDVHQAIQKERPGKLSEIILLHDSAHPEKANLMKVTMATMG